MTSHSFVVVHTAQSFHGARILAGLLESEGITARVPGAELSDEFGMAQKMTGTADVAVLEPDVETARDIVAAWVAEASGGGGDEPAGE
ncbi:MAG: hypothetical protein AAGG01_19105 [Planctomycetota bacterium]